MGIPFPNEGCRALAIDEARHKLYGITYPRNHFFVFHYDRRRVLDLGRIGDINPQCLFMDSDMNVYTAGDYGEMVCCDAERDELRQLDVQIPRTSFRDGWHETLYDVVASPDGKSIYGATWGFSGRIFRYEFRSDGDGKMTDFGRAVGPEPVDWKRMDDNHVGGLIFGEDGWLYFCAYEWWREKPGMWLAKLDPDTGERQEIGPIEARGEFSAYISRACNDRHGNIYLANCTQIPTRMYIYRPDGRTGVRPLPVERTIRCWG